MDTGFGAQSTSLHHSSMTSLKSLYNAHHTLPLPQDSTSDDVIRSLLEAGMIPVLVKLASKPTHINKKWYLTDLEVSMTHYMCLMSVRSVSIIM